MTYRYDPEIVPVLDYLPVIDIRDVEGARNTLAAVEAALPPFEAPAGVVVERRRLKLPDLDSPLDVIVFSPREREPGSGGLLYIHGGGFVLGTAEGDQVLPAQLADEANIVVVSVDYRLAPEYPFPAGIDDCYAGLVWMADNAQELSIDPARIAIGGVSAGAGLAAGVALLARDRGGPALCFQLLDIPELDDRLETPSMRAYTDTPIWNLANAEKSWEYYLGTGSKQTPIYAAPARAADLTALPPAYVAVCEFDPLRDEGIHYAQALIQAGVPTELHLFPGTFHGSGTIAITSAVSQRMRTELVDAVRRGVASVAMAN